MVHEPSLLHDSASSIEHREVWNAPDLESRRKLRIAFGINFHDNGFPGHIGSGFLNFRRGHAARPAPCRPEVGQHRHTRILHDFIKELRIHLKGFCNWGKITFACTATAAVSQVCGRNPVLASATAACSYGWHKLLPRPLLRCQFVVQDSSRTSKLDKTLSAVDHPAEPLLYLWPLSRNHGITRR